MMGMPDVLGLFTMCDDGDGVLTKEEFESCYQSFCQTLMVADPTETCDSDPVDQLMTIYDQNQDGIIEKAEFENFFAEAMTTGPQWATDYASNTSETELMWLACQGDVTGTLNDE